MQTVLLIDDDVELVEMLKEYLELEGFEVKVAHDGADGVQKGGTATPRYRGTGCNDA